MGSLPWSKFGNLQSDQMLRILVLPNSLITLGQDCGASTYGSLLETQDISLSSPPQKKGTHTHTFVITHCSFFMLLYLLEMPDLCHLFGHILTRICKRHMTASFLKTRKKKNKTSFVFFLNFCLAAIHVQVVHSSACQRGWNTASLMHWHVTCKWLWCTCYNTCMRIYAFILMQ